MSPARKLILIFVATLIASTISLPSEFSVYGKRITRPDLNLVIGDFQINKSFDLVLGLDLAGGSHLVFEADTSNLSEDRKELAVDGVKNVVERRVNLFGVSEPTVQTSQFEGKNRIVVELPGVNNTKDAVDLIGKTALLQFAELIEIPAEAEGATPSASLVPTDLTGADLEEARVSFDQQNGRPGVSLQFTEEGADKFERITERNVGRPLAMILDEEMISSPPPIVSQKISGGAGFISGNFSLEEAKTLAIQLNAGALPVPVSLVEERTVGATLGEDSINKSVKAGAVGLMMVMVFMILNYGKLGIIANIALLVFGVLTLSLYKLIPIVLTLPGVAGFLLSVGMAVDSNILIFERLKEERKRRNFADAMETAFGRAWDSIRDANIATLVTAFILANPLDLSFLHTSGPVRGFAVTLTLGILVSLFTGIVVSRNLMRVFVKQKK